MNSPTAVMTIASANYLPYVRTLMQSVRDTNPDYRRYLILVDKLQGIDPADRDLFQIVLAEDLKISSFDDMALRYDVMELNTAVKPFAIEWLFEHTDAERVFYLDPDIRLYRPLTELQAELDSGASAVVTPHLTSPLEDGKSPNDYHMLQAGVFNLGFIAVTRKQESRDFVRWWGRRLKTQCYSDVANNLFTDQRWVDLAPCFLGNLSVLRSPAYNVAYWNLMQRPVELVKNKLHFGGVPLAFFHFSGLDQNKPKVVSKHQDRLKWNDIQPVQQLFIDYRAQLTRNGWGQQSSLPYHYDQVGSITLSSVTRRLYRELYPTAPAKLQVTEEFILAMCNAPAGLVHDPEGRVTRLMHFMYKERWDLKAAFSLDTPEGINSLVGWHEISGPREYGLDDRFVHPPATHGPAVTLPPMAASLEHNTNTSWSYRRWRKFRKWLIERL